MSSDTNIEIELDIFSGRPNPRWMLSSEQVEELRAVLAEHAPAQPEEPAALGYRGFVLTNLGPDRQIPPRVRVYRSVVTVVERDRGTYYRDGRGLERALLERARQLGYGEALERFGGASTKSD